ncbi:hypothetical protein ABIE26_004859 [Pedobacter africanus]|uniref:Uncharacterized protein n=1 Tax=Pedobacter africanus TaxID=151894 RepID=A0ACC6L3Y6_9SPHI|nr:hypothetical protein [Pedobacter africanus]MDR6786140.1 hypothetical protein [Pedobacter africanus]
MNNSLKVSTCFHALVILAFATGSIPLYLLLGVTTVYVLIVNYNSFLHLNKSEFPAIIVYFVSIVAMTCVNFIEEPVVAYHLFIGIIVMLTAIIFTRDPVVYYYSSKITLIAFHIVVLSYVAFKGLDGFPAIVPFDNIVEGSSANGITSYAVLLQVNFSVISFLLFRRVSLFTSMTTLIIALLGYGRGSIIASFLILMLNLITFYALKSKLKSILYFGFTAILFFLMVGIYFDEILLFLEANTKLSAGIVDVSRSKIIKEYIEGIDLITLFKGVDYTNTSVLSEFNGNPHNSFIRAHHIFGLPYLLFVVLFPFYCIFQKEKVIEIFYYGSAVVILFFRIFSEPIILPTIFDFYFFAMFLMIATVKFRIVREKI